MGAFPRSSPFVYTAISDYVFDQVLTFTNMNTFLGNVDQLGSAFKVEHNYDSGDGSHGRITLEPNVVINPTARMGNAFWWGDGGGAASPDPDPNYANTAVWDYFHWTPSSIEGPYWKISGPSTSTQGDLSEKIDATNSIDLTISCDISLASRTGGSVNVDILCYDNAGNLLSTIASISVSVASTGGFQKFEATGVTPGANTDYIRVRKWMNNLTASSVAVGRIKVERDSIATTYSDESSMPQYLSAKYLITAGTANPSLASGVAEILDYNSNVFDGPGTGRVTPGINWVFTADRYMKLRISASLFLESDTWANGSFFVLSVRVSSTAIREIIGFRETTGGPVTRRHFLAGSTEIEMEAGDTFYIVAYQNSGNAITIEVVPIVLSGQSHLSNYISIEEIS